MPETPEQRARREIDADLAAAGWVVQNRVDLDLTAGRGIAVREFQMKPGFGFADYLLYVDRKVVGAVEAKADGTLTGVEAQSAKYAAGLPDNLPAHRRPLPFLFESNGSVTYFTNGLDPTPTTPMFAFPRVETLGEWISQEQQLRGRLHQLPPLDELHLWTVQAKAIRNLEASFAKGRSRALVQMATGSGKTFTAVNVAYRLLKHAGARRILFLVDRGNLGKQTEDEFANSEPPDDPRKLPTLYTVQRLKTNSINPAAKVVITTIQRLYSMLKGEAEFDAGNEEGSGFDSARPWQGGRTHRDEPCDRARGLRDRMVRSARQPRESARAVWRSAEDDDHRAERKARSVSSSDPTLPAGWASAPLDKIAQINPSLSGDVIMAKIIRYALIGKLVPQDPNDEPASELLKRIVAEREERTRAADATRQRPGRQTGPRRSRNARKREEAPGVVEV